MLAVVVTALLITTELHGHTMLVYREQKPFFLLRKWSHINAK